MRAAVVATLRSRPQQYAGYVLGPYDEYCASMARPGTWGDHVTLQVGRGWRGAERSGADDGYLAKTGPLEDKPAQEFSWPAWASAVSRGAARVVPVSHLYDRMGGSTRDAVT